MTSSTDTAASPATPERRPAAAHGRPDAQMSPVRPRRRYSAMGLGVALAAAGALTAGYVAQASADTITVLAAAVDVSAGQMIKAADLKTVEISTDTGLDTVPASALAGLLGQHAAVNILAGQTLTPAAAVPQLVPSDTSALVGLTISPGQAPSEPLQGGDRILVVDTPAAQADPPTTTPKAFPATVVSTEPVPDTDKLIVNVVVPQDSALDLAARAATGRIAIIQIARGTTGQPNSSGAPNPTSAGTTDKTAGAR